MPNVRMPDGTLVNMPDQLDDATGARLRAFNESQKPAPEEHGPVQDVIDMLKAVPSGVVQMLQGIGKNATEHPILGNIPGLVNTFKQVASDPSGTLTSIGSALRNATPEQVGRNVVGPLVAGGAAGEGVGAVSRLGAGAAAEAATPAGQLGLRTASGIPAKMAGNTAGPTLDAQNLKVATNVLGADAGVPHTLPVNVDNLKDARVAPGELLDNAASTLPAAPLSSAAQAKVLAARGPATITKPTPNVETQISDIEKRLTDPDAQHTGAEIRATRNSLNSDAISGKTSTDADTRAISNYKFKVVDALDQHIADTMPPNSAISPKMIQNARETLAKNYNLQDLIGKGGDINLQSLATDFRDNPNKHTGNTAVVAKFASEHPEVTGPISDADRISPPSFMGDLAGVNPLKPIGTVGQALFGALGRRLLRGPSGEAIGQAMQAPVAGLGGEFDAKFPGLSPGSSTVGSAPPRQIPANLGGGGPLDMQLTPSEGQAFEPHQGQLGLDPTQSEGVSTKGITATPLTQKLGDIVSGQRGAVGAPTDIGGLRQLMNNKRTYGGGAAVPKTAAELEIEQALKKLTDQPTTYSGVPLGKAF
jgi:hypothetical protein